MAIFWITTGVRQRKCHLCKGKIPNRTPHVKVRWQAVFKRQNHINLCPSCLSPAKVLNVGMAVGTAMFDEHQMNDNMVKTKKIKLTRLDALFNIGEEGTYVEEYENLGLEQVDFRKIQNRRSVSCRTRQRVAKLKKKTKRQAPIRQVQPIGGLSEGALWGDTEDSSD